jgi:hypothetical protein
MGLSLLASLVLLAAGPSDAPALEIGPVQAAYGPLWPERRGSEYYPGQDFLFYRFQVSGARFKDGQSLDMEVAVRLLNADGKEVLLKRAPCTGKTCFPGKPFWCIAHLPLAEPLPRGEYTAEVVVTDNVSSATASFRREVRLKAPELAVHSVQFYYDAEGKVPAPARAQVGQTLYLRVVVSNCQARDGKMEVTLKNELSEGGAAPATVNEVTARGETTAATAPATFNACTGPLLHPGHYTLRLTATDQVAGKPVTLEVPLDVEAP